jgi:imidazolonepropionase-like amidohydrolase
MAARDAFLVPTLVAYETMWNEGLEVGMPPELHAKIRPVLDVGSRSLEVAARAGVRMAYGADLIGPLHRHQSLEFRIRAAVLPAVKVIRQATVHAASLFRREGEIGAVDPGLRADLLAVDGDPIEDIELLLGQGAHLPLIMKDGRVEKNLLN